MKVQQQNDGTFLAEQRDSYGRLQIAEATTQDGAWYAMLALMDQLFYEEAERIEKHDRAMQAFNEIKTTELKPILELDSFPGRKRK